MVSLTMGLQSQSSWNLFKSAQYHCAKEEQQQNNVFGKNLITQIGMWPEKPYLKVLSEQEAWLYLFHLREYFMGTLPLVRQREGCSEPLGSHCWFGLIGK